MSALVKTTLPAFIAAPHPGCKLCSSGETHVCGSPGAFSRFLRSIDEQQRAETGDAQVLNEFHAGDFRQVCRWWPGRGR